MVTTGDIGISYRTRLPVLDEVLARFPQTFKLAAIGALFASIIGITMGVISAIKQYSALDSFISIFSLIGISMPVFWSSMLGILFFSIYLRWLPSSGIDTWRHWLIPCSVIAITMSSSIVRMTRSSMLEVVRQDYIRTARAKGQSERVVISRHALKNALIPVVTNIGMHFGVLLGGAVIMETIFVIPGVGKYITDAIRVRDYPVVQGSVLFLAITMSMVNLGIDIIYALIDPRIKSQYRGMAKRKRKSSAFAAK
jgi:peptide/nickel transport system permease protein